MASCLQFYDICVLVIFCLTVIPQASGTGATRRGRPGPGGTARGECPGQRDLQLLRQHGDGHGDGAVQAVPRPSPTARFVCGRWLSSQSMVLHMGFMGVEIGRDVLSHELMSTFESGCVVLSAQQNSMLFHDGMNGPTATRTRRGQRIKISIDVSFG